MKTFNKVHYCLFIENICGNRVYEIQKYNRNGTGYVKDCYTFKNRYEMKIFIDINGIKFNEFVIFSDISAARMVSYYEEI